MHVLKGNCNEPNGKDMSSEDHHQNNPETIAAFGKYYNAVLLSPGEVVSLTILNQRGIFRKSVAGFTGKALMHKVDCHKSN